MTPYLALVLAGYAVFVLVLGAVWLRSFLDSLRPDRSDETTAPSLKSQPAGRS
jgi:hypothetical protein